MPFELPERDPCPFCENLAGRAVDDSGRSKRWAFVERQDSVAAFVNPFQMSHGALLVVPVRHAPTVLDLRQDEAEAMARLVRRVAHAVYDALDPAGMNIFQNNGVASGQTIPHYHVHVVPRYPGDQPELLLGHNAVLIPFEERVRLAESIAQCLPDAERGDQDP